jgi:hypothetical protein
MNNSIVKTVTSTLISLKAKTTNANGEEIVDLLSNNYEVNFKSPNFVFLKFFQVKEEHLCRIDLICNEVYGDPSVVETFCKWNGITNPFSLNVGDILICPTIGTLNSFFVNNDLPRSEAKDTKATWLDPSRATKKDINRLEQIRKAAYKEKNGSTDPKPTNLLRDGEKPFEADGTALRFATYTNPNK